MSKQPDMLAAGDNVFYKGDEADRGVVVRANLDGTYWCRFDNGFDGNCHRHELVKLDD